MKKYCKCGCGTEIADDKTWVVGHHTRGIKLSDATKKKISESAKGRKLSEATKKKISDAKKGKPAHNKGKPVSEAQKKKLSEANMGRKASPEARKNMSKANRGRKKSEAHKKKIGESHKGMKRSKIACQHISAGIQGKAYDDWEAYASESKYCPLFNDACREANRAKYNYECFICGKPQSENITKTGKVRKLSVHHIDMDKNQGCDGHRWKLIPTCIRCHPGTHHEEIIARLEYLIKEN